MGHQLNRDEITLCRLLALSLKSESKQPETLNLEEQSRIVRMAEKHSVLPLLYEVLADKTMIEAKSRQTVQQSYHLLFLSKYVLDLLKGAKIEVILLKGSGTAALYPVLELRKSGDVDILLRGEQEAEAACEILEAHGFCRAYEQKAHHHISCISPDGISIELHVILAEPFDKVTINEYLRTVQNEFFLHQTEQEVMGVRLVLPGKPYHAYYLLIHMLQHFLRAGFGLKLLCDWVVFWTQKLTHEEELVFLRLIRESGMEGFAGVVTAACVRYLGLEEEKVSFLLEKDVFDDFTTEMFMYEVFEAGEFGKSSAERMVMVRGNRIKDYMREFHHQMKLTYPKASRVILAWPVLWIAALCGFIYRNHKLRGVSSIMVLKKAGDRSRMVEKMHLFDRR